MNLREHTIISAIVGLLFTFNPLGVVLSVLGSSLLDLDHNKNRWDCVSISLVGVLLCVFLFVSGCQFYLGFPLVLLGVICYLAPHRGFTHSIFGIVVLSFIVDLWYILSKMLLVESNIQLNNTIFALIILTLSVLLLSKKVLPLILCLIMVGVYFDVGLIHYQFFIVPLLGMVSHLALDCLTPKGVKILYPLSNMKFGKLMGYILLIALAIIIIINLMVKINYGNI